MRSMVIAAASLMLAFGAIASEIEPQEVYFASDEAALDAGFPEAGLPDFDAPNYNFSIVPQVAGDWEGHELTVLSIPTSTGHVFCMTKTNLNVVLYKFNGIDIVKVTP